MDFFTKLSGSHGNFHLPNETSCFKTIGIQKKSKLFPFESAFVLSYVLQSWDISYPHFLLLKMWSLFLAYPVNRSL